jgi:tetraacyldisaccharide 4'-kinase
MHSKGDSPIHGNALDTGAGRFTGCVKRWLLNGVSIAFKTASFFNLKLKSMRCHHYREAFIISIDNLSFGGTGKTTMIMEIGKRLQQHNIPFAIVTRGYRSLFENEGTSVQPLHSVREVGDEAKLFKNRFPDRHVYVGKNRSRSIERAIQDKNHIILMDDGFQSTDIYRDLKIMLINPRHPYYYLRNFKFMTGQEDVILYFEPPDDSREEKDNTYHFQLEVFYDATGNVVNLRERSLSLLGFSALGDNGRFKSDLEAFNLLEFKGYSDHHAFSEEDLLQLNRRRIHIGADYMVCTEKDFVKVKRYNLQKIPLIYAQNSIKCNLDLINRILKHGEAKEKDKH